MKIIINIPDEVYHNIVDIPSSSLFSIECDERIRNAIQNGILLTSYEGIQNERYSINLIKKRSKKK